MPSSRLMDSHAAISYAEAASLVRGYCESLVCLQQPETLALLDARGRVLARPVLADRPQPPFHRATRDGFACRAEDLTGGRPVRILGILKAGEVWSGPPLNTGESVEIMTGAPLPAGSDSVVMVEHVVRSESVIALSAGRAISPGDNFIPLGAEACAGVTLVKQGTRIGVSQIAAAASVGAARLEVYRRPRVAILATGDELVGVEEEPLAHQIRNSNSYSLAAQVLSSGGEPIIQPIAGDTPEALEKAVDAAAECDLLLLSGGVSMGKYDLVEAVLASLGARFFFTGVRMQPGKPLVFGELASTAFRQTRPFFGLPGNPVSTMVTFALFAAPVLAALGGERGYSPRFAEARLTEAVRPKAGLRRFLPARLEAESDGARVTLLPWQGSGDLAATAQANCLLVVPEAESLLGGDGTLLAGAAASVLLL